MYRGWLKVGGAALLALVATTTAHAQARTTRQFTITPSAGIMYWDESSALAVKQPAEDGQFTKTLYSPTVGIAADYSIALPFSVGFYLHAARPTTRGDYFPAVLFDYGARTEVYAVSQRVTTLMYGVQGTVDFDVGPVAPFVSAGVGATRVTLDPEQTNGNNNFTNGHFQIGGGIGFRIGTRALVKADVRDMVFMNWDRDRLNPVQPNFQNTRIPAVNGYTPPEESTIHNWRFSLGFSFVPRSGDEGSTP